ncbi:MAG: hypothetical protein E6K18_06200 [Methanobacteriota archaeon]|nr:MAG: hypothetical protein E6K18_06200 [Euryarchaeota archaeon]
MREAARAIPHLDAINLPEILDENHAGMPFYRNMDPRRFATRLKEDLPVETIVNKVVVHLPGSAGFESWLKESLYAYGLKNFVFVGGASSRIKYPGPTVPESNRRLREVVQSGFEAAIGNILIPERPAEVERLLGKTLSGCRFFTTQVLFEPEPVATVLRRYGEACGYEGIEPATILLSFAPVADYGRRRRTSSPRRGNRDSPPSRSPGRSSERLAPLWWHCGRQSRLESTSRKSRHTTSTLR